MQARIADFYCAVVIFRKLPITGINDTLHAVGSTSLAAIPTGGRGRERERERQTETEKQKERQSGMQGEGGRGWFII